MIAPSPLRAARVIVAFLGMSLLPAMPAEAAKDVFIRSKPHVNVSSSSAFVGGGTQAGRHDDPWRRRPRLKCVKPEGSAAVYCQ